MAIYKCIGCGATEEDPKTFSCSVCGHRMFEIPYDRKSKLASETERFFSSFEDITVTQGDLIFVEKEKDDKRFPDYDRIVKYVVSQNRTEAFLENLLETIEQLKKHFSTPFSAKYSVSFDTLDARVNKNDEALLSAIKLFVPSFFVSLQPLEWGDLSLSYSEIPNSKYAASVDELLNCVEQLAYKIKRFIKINNLYGNIYKFTPKKLADKFTEETDYLNEFSKAIAKIKKLIDNEFTVDLEDDGTETMRKVLTSLWHSIELVMSAPLMICEYAYFCGPEANEVTSLEKLAEKLQKRYKGIKDSLNLSSVLRDLSEDELFKLYKQLVGLDKNLPSEADFASVGEGEKKLSQLIGLAGVKESVLKIKAYALANKGSDDLNIHMCFMGNPGSGKTEVARYIAEILYENKILPTKNVIEVDRNGLVSQYFGATATKTSQVINSAMGGVLFIDEAYALGNSSESGITDYGKEAIDTLVKAMEDNRGKFCVILAGYKNEMKKMLSLNPGFQSRIQFSLDFPNYSRDELKEIAELMLAKKQYRADESVMSRMLDITDIKRKESNFANAREMRNIIEQVIMCQNLRNKGEKNDALGLVDVEKYISECHLAIPSSGGDYAKRVLSGVEELDLLIGLESIKKTIKKIRAYVLKNLDAGTLNLHMVFLGNPGTGKTEVARIVSRILYETGALQEAKMVETDAHGLISSVVGETANKTQAKIDEAMNGVLFIDEAYELSGSGFGEEATSTLLKQMEDKRGRFCVVMAGYSVEMKQMISSNPGLESRVQFVMEFPDYSTDELKAIGLRFIEKEGYSISEEALNRIVEVAEGMRNQPNFANARTIRNIVEQVIMNQNLRTELEIENKTIALEDVEEYVSENHISLSSQQGPLGFV